MKIHASRSLAIAASRWPTEMHLDILLRDCTRTTKRDKRDALLKSATVLLAASYEAYIEAVFREAAQRHHSHLSAAQLAVFLKSTSGQLHSPANDKVNRLFYYLGMPDVLDGIRWPGFSNRSVKKELTALLDERNYIAHGSVGHRQLKGKLTKTQVERWSVVVEKVAKHLYDKVDSYLRED